jgi:hypothetical protein
MRWRIEFYQELRRTLARYSVEAPTPLAAVALGRDALLADHPPTPARHHPSLFAQAGRIGGQDAGGWVLYRIAKDGERQAGVDER